MPRDGNGRPTPGQGMSGPDDNALITMLPRPGVVDQRGRGACPSVRQRARAAAAMLHNDLIDLTADDAALVPLVAQARAIYDALGGAA